MNSVRPHPSRYFVMTARDGGWLIFQEGNRRAINRLPRKNLAVETAKSLARANLPSQVLAEKRDGTLQLLQSFPRWWQ